MSKSLSQFYELGVIIGRFQIVHQAHLDIIREAINRCDRVLILVGSCNVSRSPKNPLTGDERVTMLAHAIDGTLGQAALSKVSFRELRDSIYENNRWLEQVQDTVKKYYELVIGKEAPTDTRAQRDLLTQPEPKESPIALFGFKKDDSSFYLEKFPQWDLVETGELREGISSTEIRNAIFNTGFTNTIFKDILPEATQDFLLDFVHDKPEVYGWLRDEYKFEEEYKTRIQSQYEYIRHTVDAVTTCKGHVLMVLRKFSPGKGLWALPGGHLNRGERLMNATIRELKEETSIAVPPNVLWNSIRLAKNFDHPDRSQLCRTITTAYHIPLNFASLPHVKGKDDAEDAQWFTFAEMESMRDNGEIFSDHGDIASYYIYSNTREAEQ